MSFPDFIHIPPYTTLCSRTKGIINYEIYYDNDLMAIILVLISILFKVL